MARGNWRNWKGRDGAEWYPGIKVRLRPAHCEWCGWNWNTRIPDCAVCPKCGMNEHAAAWFHTNPDEIRKGYHRHKTIAMRDYYRKHPEELKRK